MSNTQDPIKLAQRLTELANLEANELAEVMNAAAELLLQSAAAQPPGDAREAFEALQFGREFTRQPDGSYAHPMVNNDWREFQAGAAWQAAQASEPSAGLTDEQRLAWCLWRIKDLEAKLAAPARAVEPLTEDEIEEEAGQRDFLNLGRWQIFSAGVRFAESHHRIGITTPAAKAGKDGDHE